MQVYISQTINIIIKKINPTTIEILKINVKINKIKVNLCVLNNEIKNRTKRKIISILKWGLTREITNNLSD